MARRFKLCRFLISKRLKNRGFLEQRQAENLQNCAEATLALQLLANDGDQHIRHPPPLGNRFPRWILTDRVEVVRAQHVTIRQMEQGL